MAERNRSAALLLAAALAAVPGLVRAHGSPSEWTAESTEYGCWITRWLVRNPEGADAGTAVGVQVVLGRIVPPRTGPAQPGVTRAELDGATTVNVRIFDPSVADAAGAAVEIAGQPTIELAKRHLEGELGEFPSFYLSGAGADAALAALRSNSVASIVLRRPDGGEVRFASTPAGLRVALAMYDACVGAKPGKMT